MSVQTARSEHEDRESPERIDMAAVARGLREHLTAVALVLVIAQTVWRAHLLSQSWFQGDDVTLLLGAELSWSYLGQVYNGHFMPVSLLLVWAVSEAGPYAWGGVVLLMSALSLLTSLAMFWLLRSVFGPRPLLLVPLVVYLATPLTVPSWLWWAASVQAVPLQLALVTGVAAYVRWLRGGRNAWLLLVLAALLLGFGSSFAKAAIGLPLLLLATGLLLHFAHEHRVYGAVRGVRAQAGAGALVAVPTVAAGLYYLGRAEQAVSEYRVESLSEVAAYLWLLARTFPVAALGWPAEWTQAGVVAAPPAAAAGAGLLLLSFAVLTVWVRPRAGWAWLALAAYVLLVDALPLLVGRAGWSTVVASDVRYLADAAVPLALMLAFALMSLRSPGRSAGSVLRSPVVRRNALAGGSVLLVLFAVAASLTQLRQAGQAEERSRPLRDFVHTAEASMAFTGGAAAVVYPRELPAYIFQRELAAPVRFTDELLAPLEGTGSVRLPSDPEPATEPWTFDGWGHLVPAGLAGGWEAADEDGCLGGGGGALTAELDSTGARDQAALVRYAAEAPVELTVETDAESFGLDLPRAAERTVYFPLRGETARLDLAWPQEADLCVDLVAVGAVVPRD